MALQNRKITIQANANGNGLSNMNNSLQQIQNNANNVSASLKGIATTKLKVDALNFLKNQTENAVRSVTDLNKAMTLVKITRINKGSKYPYAIDATDGTELGWVKLNQLKGYASGIMRVPNDQLAWTQEQGEEAIVRNDGSILTPLSRDVSVLNADMTKNLWDFMGNPGSFLSDYSDGFVNSEKYSTKNEESNVNIASVFDNVTFNLPNVIDSQAFVRELVTNKKAERAIQAMTIDRIRGGSSLAKYKYKH